MSRRSKHRPGRVPKRSTSIRLALHGPDDMWALLQLAIQNAPCDIRLEGQTPAIVAEFRELLAPFGVTVRDGSGPPPGLQETPDPGGPPH